MGSGAPHALSEQEELWAGLIFLLTTIFRTQYALQVTHLPPAATLVFFSPSSFWHQKVCNILPFEVSLAVSPLTQSPELSPAQSRCSAIHVC